MSQNELASIYMCYNNLRDDQKKPTAQQVQKGYIEDKDNVTFPVYPLAKPVNGKKHTIDGGTTARTTVTFFALGNGSGAASSLCLKLVEYNSLLSEVGWDEKEEEYMGTLVTIEKALAIKQAAVQNKFDAAGKDLTADEIKALKKEINNHLKDIKSHRNAIDTNADRASSMLGRLVGPYNSQFNTILAEYMHPSSTRPYEVMEWTPAPFAFTKDPVDNTKLMIPLIDYDGTVYDDKDDTPDYRMCKKALFKSVVKTGSRLRTLAGISKVAYHLLVEVHGYGLAEVQRKYLMWNIKFHTTFTCKAWASMLKSINRLLPYLSTHKDDPQYANNPLIVRANVPFNEVEMCNILLSSMPSQIRDALRVQSPNSPLELELDPLVARIDAILTHQKNQRTLQKDVTRNGPPNANQKNQQKSGKSGNGGGGGNPNKTSEQNPKDGGCSNCQKNGITAWFTHGTNKCRIFEVNGNRKKDTRNVNDHAQVSIQEQVAAAIKSEFEARDARARDHYRHDRRERSRSRSRSRSPSYRSRSRRRGDY